MAFSAASSAAGAVVVVEDDDPEADAGVTVGKSTVVHTVFLVGVVVNAVTACEGVSPFFHVQHGSPDASPLVMLAPRKLALQNSGVQGFSAPRNAVAKFVKRLSSLFGMLSRYFLSASVVWIVHRASTSSEEVAMSSKRTSWLV